MRVAMTGFAKQQIRETATYIQKKFGKKYRDNFIKKVRATSLLLADNPNLGSIERLIVVWWSPNSTKWFTVFWMIALKLQIFGTLDVSPVHWQTK